MMSTEEVETVAAMTRQYGKVLSAAEARTLLKYRSASAFWTARRRGHLELEAIKVPRRKEFMYATEDVARILVRWKMNSQEASEKELPMA